MENEKENGFKKAVENTLEVSDKYQDGFQAIRKSDRKKIEATVPRNCDGSLDIDSAVKSIYPNDARWDYAIGYSNKVCYFEIHPAKPSEVTSMLNKLTWLKNWLKEKAPQLNNMPDYSPKYVWVASGKVAMLSTSKEARRLAASGIVLITKFCFK